MRSRVSVIMGAAKTCVFFVVIIALCAAQPVKDTRKEKEVPAELRFGGPKDPPQLVLECTAGSPDAKSIEYSWHKNGQPLDLKANLAAQRERSLVFQTPKPSDEGIYQCFSKSDFGVATGKPVSVKKTFINLQKAPLKNHKPIEGRPYKLECPAPESSPKPEVMWMREKQGSPPERARAHRITQGPDNNLYFSNVTQDDIYKYSCMVQSPALDKQEVLAEHVIEAVIADKEANKGEFVPQYLTEQNIMAKAGDVTMIYCIYGSSPLAFPDWTFEGKNVNNNPADRITRYNRTGGKRLLIKDTYLSDQGTYICTVDNGVGKPQSHSVHLTVVSAPTFSKKPELKVTANEGQDVILPCKVEGLKAPKASWTYNAKPLSESDRITVRSAGSSKDVTVADLTIKKVQKSDKGYYGCKAVNGNGEVYSESLLIVA